MTINMNNNVSFTLDNNCKLVTWKMIQVLQPEKINILNQWFNLLGASVRPQSIPVVDVTAGMVYPKMSLTIRGEYSSCIYSLVKIAITKNIAYGTGHGQYFKHMDCYGNDVVGHRFISVSDASVEYLEAIYENYVESLKEMEEPVEEMVEIKTSKKEINVNITTPMNKNGIEAVQWTNNTINEIMELLDLNGDYSINELKLIALELMSKTDKLLETIKVMEENEILFHIDETGVVKNDIKHLEDLMVTFNGMPLEEILRKFVKDINK